MNARKDIANYLYAYRGSSGGDWSAFRELSTVIALRDYLLDETRLVEDISVFVGTMQTVVSFDVWF